MTRPAAAPVPFVDIRINGNRASVSAMVAEARGLMEGDDVTVAQARDLFALNGRRSAQRFSSSPYGQSITGGAEHDRRNVYLHNYHRSHHRRCRVQRNIWL